MIEIIKNFKANNFVSLVRINRPEKKNALNNETFTELLGKIQELDQCPDTRVIIITGSDNVFIAGADINEMASTSSIEQWQGHREKMWFDLMRIKTPLIAAVNGYCLGAGLEFAMACDFIVASENALFGQPEINLGLIPGGGGTQRLTRLLGKSLASKYIYTGEFFDSTLAKKWNLVTDIFPQSTLLDETCEIVRPISKKSPIALGLAKESILKSFESSLRDGLEYERRNFYLTFSSADQKEGTSAFLEKRSPNFKGN